MIAIKKIQCKQVNSSPSLGWASLLQWKGMEVISVLTQKTGEKLLVTEKSISEIVGGFTMTPYEIEDNENFPCLRTE